MTLEDISVHTFPSADTEFRREAQRLVADSWRRIHAPERLIAEVQDRLRERYPNAVLRMRDADAEVGAPPIRTLYAFRDGRAA
jgi:hypothetical protein